MSNEVKLFDITDLAIQELKERYSGLTISGIDDKEGYKAVKAARIVMKGYRVDIDKRRKELNEDALKHQRFINSEAKKITEKLSEIEDYLASQEKQIDDALAAIKAEEFRQLEIKRQARIDALVDAGLRFNGNMFSGTIRTTLLPLVIVNDMSDKEFAELIAEEIEYKERHERMLADLQEQKAIQAKAAKVEQDRIAAEHAAERLRLAEEKAKADAELAAERAKLAAERAEAEAVRQLLRDQEESLQKAVIAQEEKERKAIEEAERLNAERQRAREDAKAQSELDKIESICGVVGNDPEPILISSDPARNVIQKHYLVEICGRFKVSTYAYAPSSEEAKSIALELLNAGNLDVDYEHSDCEVYENN